MVAQTEMCGPKMWSWHLVTNKITEYADQGGEFVADITWCAKGLILLHLEMARVFTQSRASINNKIARVIMMESDDITGVIVMHVHETSPYTSPSKSNSKLSCDYVDPLTWSDEVNKIKNVGENALNCIHIHGYSWISDVTCSVEIISKASEPPDNTFEAFLPGSGPIELPELDTQLADMWENHVYTAAQIAEGILYAAYARFSKWCRCSGKKKNGPLCLGIKDIRLERTKRREMSGS